MSHVLMAFAIEDRTFRGEERLALFALADGSGSASITGVSRWCGCSEAEAWQIICGMAARGHVTISADGLISSPSLILVAEGEDRERAARRKPSPRQFNISPQRRSRIYERDGHACHYCGTSGALTLDHKKPQSAGGGDEDDNLVACCKSCNSRKGTKSYDDFVLWVNRGSNG